MIQGRIRTADTIASICHGAVSAAGTTTGGVTHRISRLMWAKRSQEYLAKINTGEPGALAEVVRDLQSAGDGSNSSFSQRNSSSLHSKQPRWRIRGGQGHRKAGRDRDAQQGIDRREG